jgi:hypothetical protein
LKYLTLLSGEVRRIVQWNCLAQFNFGVNSLNDIIN